MALVQRAHAVRHDRDREHLRRHPVGRGGDSGGLDGHAAVGVPRREPSASTSRCTGRRRTSRARASPTRSRRSSRRRCSCGTRSIMEKDADRVDQAVLLRCSTRVTARPTSPRPGERSRGTREMGDLIVREAGATVLMASGLSVAVVGATGAAGQTTLRILEERKFPVRELRPFASERSVGQDGDLHGRAHRHPPHRVDRLQGRRHRASCSAGSAQAKEFAPMIVKAGATVIDKSNAFRMDPDVPLVVPEINADAARASPRHPGVPELHHDRHGDAAEAAARRRSPHAG